MDWSSVNWLNLMVFTASAFLAALIGSFIGRRNYTLTAFLTAIVFAGIYIGWSGYLKQQLDQNKNASDTARGNPPAAPKPATEKPAMEKPPVASQPVEDPANPDAAAPEKVQQ